MRQLGISVILLASFLAHGQASGEGLPGPGDRILEKSDAVLVTAGFSFDMVLRVAVAGGGALEYRLRNYIKDPGTQRALFQKPDFDRDDSAIRKGGTAYFKYRAWPKYDRMNAKSSFMDSSFTWEEALYPGLSRAYEVAGVVWDEVRGERLLRCDLRPILPGAYRRIDLWLRPGSFQTVRRVYYTPSGQPWKSANFGAYVMAGGLASDWEMTMVDEFTKASASMAVGGRRMERMLDSFFEPTNQVKEK
jgi:Outer membrane lipoprotein-sorting protein